MSLQKKVFPIQNLSPIQGEDYEKLHYLDKEALYKLLSYPQDLFWKMTLLFLYESAARVSEALNIKIKDIDFNQSRVKIITLKQKNKSVRSISISSTLESLILQYILKTKKEKKDFLFAKGEKPINRTTVNHAMRRFVKVSLGDSYIIYAHPHTLRHSRAIALLDSGMNIRLVQNFLGHSSLLSTLVYLQYSRSDLAKATQNANAQFYMHKER